MEPAFWLAAAVVLYSWLVYPALIALLAGARPAPAVRREAIEPSVTVLLVVRNEEPHLENKLLNLRALDYPRDRLEVLVVSDGSTDRTEAIAAGHADAGVKLLALAPPRGKASCLNDAVPRARGDVLVMTDARQALAGDAVRRLVACLADPTVGAASGELHLAPPTETGPHGVGLYWRYEKLIRRSESRFDSTVGVTGALYAVRKELFVRLDPRTILDDVAIPMEVALAGRRVIFEPAARATDRLAADPAHEYRRKVRTLAGNYQLLALRPALLDPFRNRLFFQLVSHKLSRLAVPWCLLVLLASSAVLALSRPGAFYRVALGLQAFFYLLAAVGWIGARATRPPRFTSVPYALVLLNLAAANALLGFVRGTETAAWKAST